MTDLSEAIKAISGFSKLIDTKLFKSAGDLHVVLARLGSIDQAEQQAIGRKRIWARPRKRSLP
jgi:hypothetical protein